ncbi:hypothetical protein PG999_007108 [Apiospora kogelbergensis]|uniref:WSC domain-containing protein n=1 Tax=Apiospora kogelbergensis TaxID=1337665 RepID=A0AAW0QXC7_9PEZI
MKNKLPDYWWITTSSILENPTPLPAPVQTGVAANCERWIMASEGDTCEDIIFRSNRGTDVLYGNNPVLGPKGKFCNTQLLAGYWYCVGLPTPGTAKTSAPLTVAPTLPTPAPAVGAVQKGPASVSATPATTPAPTTRGANAPIASSAASSSSSSLPPTSTAAKSATTTTSPAVTSAAVTSYASAASVSATTRAAITTSASLPPLQSSSPAPSSLTPSTTARPAAASSSSTPTTSVAGAGAGTTVTAPGGATYLGCASEVPNGRALNERATAGADMTIEKCLAFCAEARLPLAGLEYGSECFCGTTLAPPSALVGNADCRMPCSGNAGQKCGGPSLLSVTALQKVGGSGFEYQGCFEEGKTGRVLPDAMMGNETLTVEGCMGFCAGRGFGVAGVEYGRECWCGKALPPGAVRLDEGRCDMRCKGEGSQLCGGSGAIGIYEKKGNGGGGKAKREDTGQEQEQEEEAVAIEGREERDSSIDGENENTKYAPEEERPPTVVKTIRLIRRGRWGGRQHA